MKAANLKNAQSIGCSMRRLRHALEPVTGSAPAAEEIAFHLAELKPELRRMVRLLSKVEKAQGITPGDVAALLYLLGVHWPYHLGELQKGMKLRSVVRYAGQARAAKSAGVAGGLRVPAVRPNDGRRRKPGV